MEYNVETLDKLNRDGIKRTSVNSYSELRRLSECKDFVLIKGPICHAKYKDIEIDIKNAIPTWDFIECKCNDDSNIDYIVKYIKEHIDSCDNVSTIYLENSKNKMIDSGAITFDLENGSIKNINIPKINSLEEVDNLLSLLDNNLVSYNQANIKMENKTYDGLEDMCEKYKGKDIECSYGAAVPASLDDFTSMRSTIDYFKSIVPDCLSPVEKAMFLFDEVKSFSYKENNSDLSKSRYIPTIVSTGNIVCAGYANFLVELMKECGIKADTMNAEINLGKQVAGHSRVIAKIDDPKYNLHGLYIFDPTWNSKKDNLAEVKINGNLYMNRFNDSDRSNPENKEIINEYDVMSDYRFFMIPLSDFEKVFKNENNNFLLSEIREGNIEEDVDNINNGNKDKILLYNEIKYFFGDNANKEDVKSYIQEKGFETDDFIKCLNIVKDAEGYKNETEKVVRESAEIRNNFGTNPRNKDELNKILDNEFNKEENNKKTI